jgi:hypothetical protein
VFSFSLAPACYPWLTYVEPSLSTFSNTQSRTSPTPRHQPHNAPLSILQPQAYKFKRSATGLFLRGGVLDKPQIGAMTFVVWNQVTQFHTCK